MGAKKGIPIICPSCGHSYSAPTEYAGRKSRCKCGEIILIPSIESKPSLTEKSSNTTAVVVAYGVVAAVAIVAVVLATLGNQAPTTIEQPAIDRPLVDSEATAAETPTRESKAKAAPTEWTPPFEYQILKHDKTRKFGPNSAFQHAFIVETTVQTAKGATEDNIRELWENYFSKVAGQNTWVFVKFFVETPGASTWANISRTPEGEFSIRPTEWELRISINEYCIDPEPYHFVERIDRSVSWQKTFAIDLPTANRIREAMTNAGFETSYHGVDLITLDVPPMSDAQVSIEPERLSLSNWRRDKVDNERVFWLMNQIALSDIGIWNEVHRHSQSAIGSPKYFQADKGEQARWTWTIGDYEVKYTHSEFLDEIDVTLRQEKGN